MNIPSPCTQVCRLDNRNICIGCFRTGDEIARWMQMTENEKSRVLANLAERRFGGMNAFAREWEVASHE
jgi:uncharacterized protein